jgi:uncharacterized membrane protein
MAEAKMALWVLTLNPMAGAAQMPGMEGSPAGQAPFGHADGHMMGWHWGWWLLWLFIAVVVIWALVRLATSRYRDLDDHGPESSEEARRRRYTAGEITRDE